MASNSNAENIENESNSSKISILRGSKLNPLLKSSMLRPSQFQFSSSSTSNETKTSDTIQANTNSPNTSKFNPFLKFQENEEDDNSSASNDKKTDKEKIDTLSILTKNGLPKSNLFKPLQPPSENKGFVFGQNVHERVTGDIVQNSLNNSDQAKSKESDDPTTDGTKSPELLFSNAVQKTSDTQTKETNSKSLTEAAREYEESRAQKRKYDEVETITGEEDESNVLEIINCKLFAFVASTWEERGRGCLRLNDSKNDIDSSRVVFRTSGSLRVLLNTKIWRGMIAEQPSRKSLRLTAIDSNGHIKVFLIMAGPDDVELLHSALNERINIEKARKIEVVTTVEKKDNDDGGAGDDDIDNKNGEPSPKKLIIST